LEVLPTLLAASQPLVLCGPSGVGKSYVLQALCAAAPVHAALSVSHTSRQPRGVEQDGVEYHFRSAAEIEALAADGKMVEHDWIHNQLYGTSVAAVALVHAQGKVCLLDMTVPGAVQFVSQCTAANQQQQQGHGIATPYCVHLRPPSMQELGRRLAHRGTESKAQLAGRLASAAAELLEAEEAAIWDMQLIKQWVD
jgi:guanylate kinase